MVRSGREANKLQRDVGCWLADSNSDAAQDFSWGEADIPDPAGERSCMEPIVSAGLVYLAHRTMPFLSWTPPTLAAVPFLRGEDIMSITTLLIILLVVLLLGGGGFYARRRW